MMNSKLMQRFQAAAETIRQRVGEAEIGVILGSGLGDYVDALQDAKYIDYKDINRLRRFTNERGKILPRRMSGNCAKHQRQLSEAIKRARAIALLPFTVD